MGSFFSPAGDARMEKQNSRNWKSLLIHVDITIQEGSIPERLDVLDIGSHTGGLLELMRDRLGTKVLRSLAGVEPLDEARREAQRRLPGATFFRDMEEVPDRSIDLVVSHEALYLIEDLGKFSVELTRILSPEGGAFIALGSHGENTAWLRWRKRLQELYGHKSYVHQPMNILEVGARAGFDMEVGHLHLKPLATERYSPPEDGWGEFVSVEEALNFQRWKYVFVFYPKV